MIQTELPKESYKALAQYNKTAVYAFRFDAEEDTENNTVKCTEETVIVKNATYDTMVSALVHVKYSADAETAVIANIIAEPDSDTRKAEFATYQEWRNYCKTTAKDFFDVTD